MRAFVVAVILVLGLIALGLLRRDRAPVYQIVYRPGAVGHHIGFAGRLNPIAPGQDGRWDVPGLSPYRGRINQGTVLVPPDVVAKINADLRRIPLPLLQMDASWRMENEAVFARHGYAVIFRRVDLPNPATDADMADVVGVKRRVENMEAIRRAKEKALQR
jgi:hypothetical protein